MCLRRMFYRLDLVTPRGCCQRVSGGEYRSRIASATDACDTTDRPRPPLYPLPFPLSRRQIAPRSSRHISLRSALSGSLRLSHFDLRIRSNSVHFFHSSVHCHSRLHPHRLQHYFSFHSGLKHRVATSLGEKNQGLFKDIRVRFQDLFQATFYCDAGILKVIA